MIKIKEFLKDCYTMTSRCLRLSLRNPEMSVMSVVVPIVFLVIFVYLLGGAMGAEHFGGSYINYVLPGILIMTIGMNAAVTSAIICSDVKQGILDRFISLPISRSSFLVGHVMSSVIRNIISTAALIAAAFAMGFRPEANFVQWLGVIGLLLCFMFIMVWLSVLFGLLVKTIEGANFWSFIQQIFVFISSALVPTATMPAALRYFAEYQPISPIIDTLRSLFLGGGDARVLETILWSIGLLAIGYIFSLLAFKRKMK